MFEAVEKSLSSTSYDGLVQELFFGNQNTVLTCLQCGKSRKRPEPFLDLPLQVKGIKGVNESLQNYFGFEELDGVECEHCNEKTL